MSKEQYRGYTIEENIYHYPIYENTKFIFYNPLDLEIPIGMGKSVKDYKEQIEENFGNNTEAEM
ncbi:hypothetical protein [Flavobacterium sp. W22_SRS_FP1]|uniref:hypothetical protein n=1 Tax=Flavobacterium sp. W22_SRS_FP1 TaxID=3240276 RepID=UPI003F8E0C4D